MKSTRGEKTFYIINEVILFILAICCIYPVIYVAAASISSVQAVSTGKVILLPKEVTFVAYKEVFKQSDIWIGYFNAFYYAIVGTAVNIVMTILGAYPLSKKKLVGKKLVMAMVVLTMFFSAGIIPTYLNFVELGLLNTRAAIVIGFACTSMYVIIMKTFFESIPDSLEEAAIIDGANQWQVLLKIYIPLSGAAIATVGLMYCISRWNGYFWSMVLLDDASLQPLQVVLKRVIVDITFEVSKGGDKITNYSQKMLTYAIIMVSIIPMLIVYPFIQKYFEKGVMIGSVKG